MEVERKTGEWRKKNERHRVNGISIPCLLIPRSWKETDSYLPAVEPSATNLFRYLVHPLVGSQLLPTSREHSFRSLQHSLHSYNSIEIVRFQRLFKFSRTVTTVLTAETLRTDRKSEGKGGRKRERGRRRKKDGGSVHEGGGGRRSSSCWNGMRKLVLRKEEEATARVSGVTTAWSTRQACRKRDDTVRGCCAVSEARLLNQASGGSPKFEKLSSCCFFLLYR